MSDLSTPATRHAVRADAFGRLVAGTTDWTAPTPVPDWAARDVVRHLVEWLPGFLDAAGVTLTPGPDVDDDPSGAWHHQSREVQELLEHRGDEPLRHPRAGEHRLADAIDTFYTPDVLMHSWDLARATGQPEPLDEETCAAMLSGMRGIEEVLRASGQYGAAHPVDDDAGPVEKLMAFVGRVPQWRPPGRTDGG